EWPISIPMDDRRFMVLDVAETERQRDEYFDPLREELRDGGVGAILHDLMAHEIDEHALRHPPSTAGKREVMTLSLKPIERWRYEKLRTRSFSLTSTHTDDDGHTTSTYLDGWPSSVLKDAL